MLLLSSLALATFNCSILLGGDVMLNGVAPSATVWQGIETAVKSADVAIANLEIPLTDSKTATRAKTAAEVRARDQFILKTSPQHAPLLARAGWDLVSLGNNHTMDYGSAGLNQMIDLLRKHGVGYAGAGSDSSIAANAATFRTKGGTRISLISAMAFVTHGALLKTTPATKGTPGVHGLSFGGVINDRAKEQLSGWVSAARRQADVVVVGIHWGLERRAVPSSYQVALGRALVDAGADIVWGHHPHVLQGAEIFKGKPILYSAGNLISPLPGETALFKLQYSQGRLLPVEVMPASISGGKVSLNSGAKRTAGLNRFKDLCRQLVKAYPHPESQALVPL